MNRILKYIHRSLSTRLSLLVVTFVAIIFIVAYGQIFNQTRQMVRDSAWNKATATLDGTAYRQHDACYRGGCQQYAKRHRE